MGRYVIMEYNILHERGQTAIMETTYRTLLRNKNYRRLLFANMINRLGDSVDTLAFSWLVYAFTGEGTWAAIVFAVNKIPSVLFLPLSGAYVEKKIKKNIMILCDMIRALLVAVLLICMNTNTLSLIVLILFSFLISAAEAFRIPAGVSFITQLLDEDELSYGVSLNVLVSMLAEVAGTGIGGLIISCLNINAAFVVDIATFVLSIVMIWMIMKKETIAENLEKKNSLIIFKEGLQYVKSKKILIRVILFAVFANAVMAPIDSLQTPVVVDILKQNAAYLSLLNICLTVGVLLGGAVYPIIQKKVRSRVLFGISGLFIAFLYVLIAVMEIRHIAAEGIWYYGIALCYLCYGVFAGFMTTGLGILLMKYTDQEYMSRTNTIYTAIGEAVVPVASAAAGVLLKFCGMDKVFLIVAVCIVIVLTAAGMLNNTSLYKK